MKRKKNMTFSYTFYTFCVICMMAIVYKASDYRKSIIVHAQGTPAVKTYNSGIDRMEEMEMLSKLINPVVEPTETPRPTPTQRQLIEKYAYLTFGSDHYESALEVIRCESGFNPDAQNKVSSARGLGQITWGTWEHMKCYGARDNYKDNIDCMHKIWEKMGKKFNTTLGWSASYSCHKQD